MALVGLDESLLTRHRLTSLVDDAAVAIAGSLDAATSPSLENRLPDWTLRPFSMMEMFARLRHERDLTVVLVTHQMDDVNYADNVIVMDRGQIVKTGTPRRSSKILRG